MSDNKFKRKFEWEETIPKIEGKGNIFHDEIFAFKVGSSQIIKISVSLFNDHSFTRCMVKATEGLELLSGLFNLRLECILHKWGVQGSGKCILTTRDLLEKLKSGIEVKQDQSPAGEFMYTNHIGKKVTYNLTIEIELKKKKKSSPENYLKLPELLFMKKELCDIKLICEGKTFECLKSVLTSRSEVFEAMFKSGTKMVESESGEVKIEDAKADTLENMIYFMYHDKVLDEKMIKADLLILAERYNVQPLTAVCVEYLEENLSLENAVDVLVSANLTNKKALFDVAEQFVWENREILAKTNAWNELSENDPILFNKIMKAMLKIE